MSGISDVLLAIDEAFACLDRLGEQGRHVTERTRHWKDAILHAPDSAWARFYADSLTAQLAAGIDWQLPPDEVGCDGSVDRLSGLVRAWDPSPWADVDLRSVQAERGIGPGDIRTQAGRPPVRGS